MTYVKRHIRQWIGEAGVGLLVGAILFVVAVTTVTSVHFVYQGF